MKSKSIIFALLVLILACSITAISAENAELSEHTFEIPDGYSILNSTDESIQLTNDKDDAIFVLFSDKIANKDDAQKDLESEGYKFLGEDAYDAVDFNVTQQNFEKDGYTVYSYVFEVSDGEYCVITLTLSSDETAPEGNDNPVTGILETLE